MAQSQEPASAASYFGRVQAREHARVVATFRPGVGWRNYPGVKRISASWARKQHAAGVTSIQLSSSGRRADFTVHELMR